MLLGLSVIFLGWVARGFMSPASFRPGAVLAWAESHDALMAAMPVVVGLVIAVPLAVLTAQSEATEKAKRMAEADLT